MSRQLLVVPETRVTQSVTTTVTSTMLLVGLGALVVTTPSLSTHSPTTLVSVVW